MGSGRSFINDAHFGAVDRVHSVDDAQVRLPRVNQVYYILTVLCMEKLEPALTLILGIELGERQGRDFSE